MFSTSFFLESNRMKQPTRNPSLISDGPAYERSGLVHRVHQPDTPGPHPTVVMLHGRFGNEDVMWVFARALPPDWLVLSVRAIVPEEEGYSWHADTGDWPDAQEFDTAVAAIVHFLQTLPSLYNANSNRLYLMGFSQGAAAAYLTAMRHPQLVQGIAGLVGFMPLGVDDLVDAASLQNLPVLMLVGESDPLVPILIARKCGKAVRAAGANLSYHELDTGHKLNAAGTRLLRTWWQEQADADISK